MLWLILAVLPSSAGQAEEPFSVGAWFSGPTGAACGSRYYRQTDRQEVRFELKEDSLVLIQDVQLDISLEHSCQLGFDRAAFEIDSIVTEAHQPFLRYSGSGRDAQEHRFKDAGPRVMKAGWHTVAISIAGTSAVYADQGSVKMTGTIVSWRDADDDGDLPPALGGTDCDDEDPNRAGTLPDYRDDIDNDCDDVIDNDDDRDGLVDAHERDFECDDTTADTDGDGIDDAIEWGGDPERPVDTDADGTYDFADDDSDDDGVPDEIEWEAEDTDGDGIYDFRDEDDDGDGLPTSDEVEGDADQDGTPNYLDPDCDGDGVLDGAEGTGDSDGDGIPDLLDAGSDLDQRTEPTPRGNAGFGWGCSSSPGPASAGWLLLGMLALRRRTRTGRRRD